MFFTLIYLICIIYFFILYWLRCVFFMIQVFFHDSYHLTYCFSFSFLLHSPPFPSFSPTLVLFLFSLILVLFLFSSSSLLLFSPVVSEGQYNKIWSYIDEARDLGYRFLYGGDRQLVSVESGNVIREKVSNQLYSLSSFVFQILFL